MSPAGGWLNGRDPPLRQVSAAAAWKRGLPRWYPNSAISPVLDLPGADFVAARDQLARLFREGA